MNDLPDKLYIDKISNLKYEYLERNVFDKIYRNAASIKKNKRETIQISDKLLFKVFSNSETRYFHSSFSFSEQM